MFCKVFFYFYKIEETIEKKIKIIAFHINQKNVSGVKLNFRSFSIKTKSLFIVYGTLYLYLKYCPSEAMPLPIFYVTNRFHASRNSCFLRWSIHRSIFRYLLKIWNAVMTYQSGWLESNDNQIKSGESGGEGKISHSCLVYIFYGFCYMWTSIVMEQY